jgi:hypothetical protein
MDDDPDIVTGKSEMMHAIHECLHYHDTSLSEDRISRLVEVIDTYIELKIAIATEMLADRYAGKLASIEAATNVRP